MSREDRKVRVGRVVTTKMTNTVVVAVQWQKRHTLYRKPQRRITKFFAHDGDNKCSLGDLVKIEETRPISRNKRWRVVDILERRDVAEVKPMELDQEILGAHQRGGQALQGETSPEKGAVAVAQAEEAAVETEEPAAEPIAQAEETPVQTEEPPADAAEEEPVAQAEEASEEAAEENIPEVEEEKAQQLDDEDSSETKEAEAKE